MELPKNGKNLGIHEPFDLRDKHPALSVASLCDVVSLSLCYSFSLWSRLHVTVCLCDVNSLFACESSFLWNSVSLSLGRFWTVYLGCCVTTPLFVSPCTVSSAPVWCLSITERGGQPVLPHVAAVVLFRSAAHSGLLLHARGVPLDQASHLHYSTASLDQISHSSHGLLTLTVMCVK